VTSRPYSGDGSLPVNSEGDAGGHQEPFVGPETEHLLPGGAVSTGHVGQAQPVKGKPECPVQRNARYLTTTIFPSSVNFSPSTR